MFKRVLVACFLTMGFLATAAQGQTPAPAIQTVTVTNGDVIVTGTPVTGATSYKLDVSSKDKTYSVTSSTPTLQVPAGSFPANTTISMKMQAVDSKGTSSTASAPASAVTAPAAPTSVKGLGGPNRVTVSWQPSPGAASYMVTLSNGMSIKTTSTSHVFTGLPTATSFHCIVWAYNAAGAQSPGSAPVAVRTANIAPVDDGF